MMTFSAVGHFTRYLCVRWTTDALTEVLGRIEQAWRPRAGFV